MRTRPTVAAPKDVAGELAQEASDATKAKALTAYRELGTVTAACDAAQIGRRTWYDWLAADPVFARAVADAHEAVSDDLEQEASKRAKEGSDTLLIFLLKARRPERYRDRLSIEHALPREEVAQLMAEMAAVVEEHVHDLHALERIRDGWLALLGTDANHPRHAPLRLIAGA